jgi:muconolactone delta-isomerase
VSKEIEKINELKRQGLITDFQMSAPDDPEWRAFIRMRAVDENAVRKHLESLPLSAYLNFEITRIVPSNQNVLVAGHGK